MIKKFLKLADLTKSVRFLSRKLRIGSFLDRMNIDSLPRTEFAYSMYYAAMQAKMLGISKISAIEFGVAGGNGILLIEKYAAEVFNLTGVEIEVYGFDTAEGMPSAIDHRDLPYIWEKGFFRMDFTALNKKLNKAKLIIGNVENTVETFVEEYKPAPIGFISFDLDYYSSTVSAFRLFENDNAHFLPRVYCFFDDCVGDDWELHSEFAGELLAIEEFNQSNSNKKLGHIYGLKHKRQINATWNDELFILHIFDHQNYNDLCNPKKNWQLPLA